MPKLELRGIHKGFGEGTRRREVLAGLDLDVEAREFVAIVGYSGVGKSTLISLVAGLLSPDAGEVLVDGAPVRGPGKDRGVVFQNYALLPWLSAQDNVALAVEGAALTPEQRRTRVEHSLSLVQLAAAGRKKPRELSGGMRQRVSIARALALDPEILLLDEPLGALDALTRGSLQRELESIVMREAKTVLMITNDVDEALLLADRVIPLSLGPSATFGPEVRIDRARPRDPKQMAHDPEIKRLRLTLVEYLLAEARARRPFVTAAE